MRPGYHQEFYQKWQTDYNKYVRELSYHERLKTERVPNSVEGYYRSQHSKAGGAATQRTTGRFRGQKERLRQARYLRIPKYIVRSRDAVVIVVNRLHSVRKLST
jgi:hypothetical protein